MVVSRSFRLFGLALLLLASCLLAAPGRAEANCVRGCNADFNQCVGDVTVDDFWSADYWSATTSVADPIRACTLRFTAGSAYAIGKDGAYHLRAVRGGP